MSKCRTTHHLACDCREDMFAEMQKRVEELEAELANYIKSRSAEICWEQQCWEVKEGDSLLDLVEKMDEFALSELSGLVEQVMSEKKYHNDYDVLRMNLTSANQLVEEYRAREKKLVEALRFYADIGNWTMHGYDGCPGIISTDDLCDFDENGVSYFVSDLYDERPGGKTARATLKELGVE